MVQGEYALRGNTVHRRGFLETYDNNLSFDTSLAFDRDLIILAFTNRSGSNHLAELICKSPKVYGFREDLNREQTVWAKKAHQINNLTDYLQFIVARQAKADAAFGLKASAEQIRIVNEFGFDICFNAVKIVRAHRRDRVAQAVSLFVARRTKQWSSKMSAADACLDYDPKELRRALNDIQCMESALDLVLSSTKYPVCDVYYEDLCADRETELARVSGFLDLSLPTKNQPVELEKQASDKKTELVSRFRADLMRDWGMRQSA